MPPRFNHRFVTSLLRAEFRAEMRDAIATIEARERLIARISPHVQHQRHISLWSGTTSFMQKTALATGATLVVFLGALGMGSQSLPGDFFYEAKIWAENITLASHTNSLGQAKAHLEIVRRRVAELERALLLPEGPRRDQSLRYLPAAVTAELQRVRTALNMASVRNEAQQLHNAQVLAKVVREANDLNTQVRRLTLLAHNEVNPLLYPEKAAWNVVATAVESTKLTKVADDPSVQEVKSDVKSSLVKRISEQKAKLYAPLKAATVDPSLLAASFALQKAALLADEDKLTEASAHIDLSDELIASAESKKENDPVAPTQNEENSVKSTISNKLDKASLIDTTPASMNKDNNSSDTNREFSSNVENKVENSQSSKSSTP